MRRPAALPRLTGWRNKVIGKPVQLLRGAIRRAVVDDHDADAKGQRRLDKAADGARFVVGGDDDPDALVGAGVLRALLAGHRESSLASIALGGSVSNMG